MVQALLRQETRDGIARLTVELQAVDKELEQLGKPQLVYAAANFFDPQGTFNFRHRAAADYLVAARQRGEPRQAGWSGRAFLRDFPALAICVEGGRNGRRATRGAGPLDHRPATTC